MTEADASNVRPHRVLLMSGERSSRRGAATRAVTGDRQAEKAIDVEQMRGGRAYAPVSRHDEGVVALYVAGAVRQAARNLSRR